MYVAFLGCFGGLWSSFFQIAKLLALKDKDFQILLSQKTLSITSWNKHFMQANMKQISRVLRKLRPSKTKT